MDTSSTATSGPLTHQPETHKPASQAKPEWVRLPEATRLFGLSRSSLYELIAAGSIRSTCLKKRGALKGIRLISYDSLAAFMDKTAAAGGIVE